MTSFAHLTLILLPHYLVNAEVVVWTFTTMNSSWVEHTVSENEFATTKSSKICYLFTVNQEQVYVLLCYIKPLSHAGPVCNYLLLFNILCYYDTLGDILLCCCMTHWGIYCCVIV